jgi:hypothetical protein
MRGDFVRVFLRRRRGLFEASKGVHASGHKTRLNCVDPPHLSLSLSLSPPVTSTLHPTHAPPSHAQENNPCNSHSLATTPWFAITGTHMFITSGTSTVMTQHHLHHVDGSTLTAPHCL